MKDQSPPEEKTDKQLEAAVNWFAEAHPPVQRFEDSNHYMTTKEIQNLLSEEMELYVMYIGNLKDALREVGYKQEDLGGTAVWLLEK